MRSPLSEALIKTPCHSLLLRFDEEGLVSSRLVSSRLVSADEEGEPLVRPQHQALLGEARRWVEGYFARRPAPLPLLNLSALTPFRQRVLRALLEVGFGERVSYQQLAALAGAPRAARAVGGAMAGNPLPLLVPCHRVIQSSGALGSYSGHGGVDTKRLLLEYEAQGLPFAEHQRALLTPLITSPTPLPKLES